MDEGRLKWVKGNETPPPLSIWLSAVVLWYSNFCFEIMIHWKVTLVLRSVGVGGGEGDLLLLLVITDKTTGKGYVKSYPSSIHITYKVLCNIILVILTRWHCPLFAHLPTSRLL